jgi:hypothetical protein
MARFYIKCKKCKLHEIINMADWKNGSPRCSCCNTIIGWSSIIKEIKEKCVRITKNGLTCEPDLEGFLKDNRNRSYGQNDI